MADATTPATPTLTYEVQETPVIAVKVFYNGNTVPTLYQPHYPNGTVWKDVAEADAWAKLYVASVTDPAAPFAPNAPGEAGKPKPTPEEIAAMQAQMKAQTSPVPPTMPSNPAAPTN